MRDTWERIREATIAAVLERGYAETTTEEVIERAGVSREDFDASFDGKQDLMLKVFDDVTARYDVVVYKAFEAHDSWRDSLRACAYAAARYLRDQPREVAFGVTHMLQAGDLAQVYRERHLQRMVDLVDLGRQELDDPDSMGRGVAEGVIGSIYSLLVKEIQDGNGTVSAVDFVPQMMYVAVRPYLGHEVAHEELTIPPPPEEEVG
jgi:AcrR family transcriptional regulator